MQLTAAEDVQVLGLVFESLPPGKVMIKNTLPDSWARKSGFVGGEQITELNGQAATGMSSDSFKDLIRERPLTIAFNKAQGARAPAAAPSPPETSTEAAARTMSLAQLDSEVNVLMKAPGSYKAIAGLIALVRSSLKAAGMRKHGVKWTKVFYDLDVDGSGNVSWSEFQTACKSTLALKEGDVQLRLVFRSLGVNDLSGVNVNELVGFLVDPLDRMKKKFKAAASKLSDRDWNSLFEDSSIKFDWVGFVGLCRDSLGLLDEEVQLWTVFRALAGPDCQAVLSDQIRLFSSDTGSSPTASKPPAFQVVQKQPAPQQSSEAMSRAVRRANSRSLRQAVMEEANAELEEQRGRSASMRSHSIKSAGSNQRMAAKLTDEAAKYQFIGEQVTNIVDSMELSQAEFPARMTETMVGHLDQNVFREDGQPSWLGLTDDDWVVVMARNKGDGEYSEVTRETPIRPGAKLVFINRPSATSRCYATHAADHEYSRTLLGRMRANDVLPENIVVCRTDHIFKGAGRVSVSNDNKYVILKGAKLLEITGEEPPTASDGAAADAAKSEPPAEGSGTAKPRPELQEYVFSYAPKDRIARNCGKVRDSCQKPELDFFICTEELTGEGKRLGPTRGKIEGMELREKHGLNVICIARKEAGEAEAKEGDDRWTYQWCPMPNFAVLPGDVCITTRRQEGQRVNVPGLVHVASYEGVVDDSAKFDSDAF